MTITYLNADLDSSKEHELLKINDFGFKVEINYNKNSWIYKHRKKEVLNNVTEVHSLFDKSKDIAFESDIHAEGFTRKLTEIDSVIILLETEINSKPNES